MLNVEDIKKDFPILSRKINGKTLVYLDNAATTQKPTQVIDAISDYYKNHNANVHRGIHTLSEEASTLYENTRKSVSEFIGAVRPKEIVFTSGTTDSLNLVAFGWAIYNLEKGDEVLICNSGHHSNIVPWQIVAKRTGAILRILDTASQQETDILSLLKEELSDRVKIVVVSHANNVTGAIMPIKEVSKLVRGIGAKLVVDGAQAAPHMGINMQSLGCDFYAFSAHKMLGPTGVGVLWGHEALLENMQPYKYGGGMIDEVTETNATWAKLPDKLEAGTPNIAGVIAFSSAIDYLKSVGLDNIRQHEIEMNAYTLEVLSKIKGLHIIGPAVSEKRTGLVSFHIDGLHAHDVAAILDTEGVAVRSGHHCAMPLHTKLNISASTRASYYLYNSTEDIDKLVLGITKAIKMLK